MATTTFTETSAYHAPNGLIIGYKCSRCGKTPNMPEQQGFNYCYLCGARVRRIRSSSLTWNPLDAGRK